MSTRLGERCRGWLACCLALAWILGTASSRDLLAEESRQAQLWRHRNIGQAYLETAGRAGEAVTELRAAVALDPASAVDRYNLGLALLASGAEKDGIEQLELAQQADGSLARTWFRLALAYEEAGRLDDAIAQMSGLLTRRRDEAVAHLRLGLLRQAKGDLDMARDHLEAAALLAPRWAAPHFHLSGFHQRADRSAAAAEEMEIFRSLEARGGGSQVDGDPLAHPLASFYEDLDARHSIAEVGDLAFSFQAKTLARDVHGASAFLRAMDVDGDGGSDLWLISAYQVALYGDGQILRKTALDSLRGVLDLAAADFDGDALIDLCVLTGDGAQLWRNTGGDFEPVEMPLPPGSYDQTLWLDYDHDGHLDLLLLGRESALVRNRGDGSFVDRTAGFPFVQGWVHSAAVLQRPFDGGGTDLVVVYRERRGVLYRDLLGGDFEPKALLNVPLALSSLDVGDLNNDGFLDLAAGNPSMAALFLNDLQAGFRRTSTPLGATGPVLFADLAGRGVVDLLAGGLLFPNRGLGRLDTGRVLDGWPRLLRAAVASDFDRDGRIDVAALGDGGRLVLLLNGTPSSKAIRVQLTGKSVQGAVVEVKVGPRYQQQPYAALPLDFALGEAPRADVVRVRWPGGGRHYEVDVAAGSHLHIEHTTTAETLSNAGQAGLSACGKRRATLRAAWAAPLFSAQLSVANSRKTTGIPAILRLDLTKNGSLSQASDFHHRLLSSPQPGR